MSTNSNAAFVSAHEGFILANDFIYAVTALVAYEYVLNFKYEIDFLWRRKWSAATWIFMFNRYILLADVIFASAPGVPQICANTQAMNFVSFFSFGTLPSIPAFVFTILRSFALLHNHTSWRIYTTCLLAIMTVMSVSGEMYVDFTQTWEFTIDPVVGPLCNQIGASVSASIIRRVNTAGVIVSIAAAAIVLSLTLMKTCRQVKQASALGLTTSLSSILLRDGSLLFLLILVEDTLSAVFLFDNVVQNGALSYILSLVFHFLPKILLTRFIINLRQVDSGNADASANVDTSRFSAPNFRMPTMNDIVGNLGEPLDFVEYCVDDEDEGDARGRAETDDADFDTDANKEAPSAHPSGRDIESASAPVDVIQLEEIRFSLVPPA